MRSAAGCMRPWLRTPPKKDAPGIAVWNWSSGDDSQLGGHRLVHVAPDPAFPRLNGAHQRVARGMKMLRGVLVLGGITAAHLPADQAKAQMHPGVAGLQALFAAALVSAGEFDLIHVLTGILHFQA